MLNNISIENSEQHQLACCLGRMLAVRPGTLCPGPSGRNKPLSWGDIKITTCDEPGQFNINVEFENIAIKISNNPDQQEDHPLNVTIKSATSHEDLIFSPSHRLLVIAIRRGLLQGISTLEELLNTNLQIIQVKPEYLNEPIFYQSTPKGTSLNFNKPLRAASLTDYLRNRSHALGYPSGITFYSIRRKIASDLVRRVGLETARNMMGHAPESHTLKRSYLSLGPTLDVQAIATEAPMQAGGVSDQFVAEWAPFAQSRLSDTGIQKTRGAALRAYAAKPVEMDPAYPHGASVDQLKAYRKKVRRRAQMDLMDQERTLEQSRMTRAEFRDRLGATKASSFAKAVLDRAAQSVQALADMEVDMNDGDNDDFDDEIDTPEEEPGEVDLEEAAARAGTRQLSLDVEHDESNAIDASAVPFKELARSFMESLLHNTMSNTVGTWAEGDQRCVLCLEDETTSQADKEKKWDKQAKLIRHQQTMFHSARRQWERRVQSQHDAIDPNGPWYCPYCPESDRHGYGRLNEVIQHLQRSKKDDPAHDRLMAEDGWLEEDFASPRLSAERERSRERHARRSVEKLGYNFVHEPPELPFSIPFTAPATSHTFHRGGPSVFTDPPPGAKPGMMTTDYNDPPPGTKVGFPSSTREFMGWETDKVPPHLQQFMEAVETPRPFTDMWDEEAKAKNDDQSRRSRQ
ncbi:uncharacterized protein IWZ02DRAFT_450515 [Phyllosticta citriasiana]|uniref:uncharacterized protein n=1 Tax=Phyllosticta citriasiana TaxID=595635 RepID=UPI0030FDDA4C